MLALSTAIRRLRTRGRLSGSTTTAPERDPPSPLAISPDPLPLSSSETDDDHLCVDAEGSRAGTAQKEDEGDTQGSPEHDDDEEVDPDSWPYPPLACSSPEPTPSARASLNLLSPGQSESPFSSPCDSQVSLLPSPHTSSSSLSASVAALSHSPPLGLTISIRLDPHGRRVLTSRRRLSVAPSPTKCRRNRAAFGIGDGDSDGVMELEAGGAKEMQFSLEEDEPALVGPEKATSPSPVGLAPTSVPLDYVSTLSFVAADELTPVPSRVSLDLGTPKLSSSFPRSNRPPRPAPPPLAPLSLSAATSSLPSSPVSEHQPIKVFTPPPPLYPSSPTRSSTFAAHLTRATTLVHNSSSSSNSSNAGSSSSATRRLTLHSRKTLKRLSRNSVSYPSPASAATLPIDPPTMSTQLSRRRSSFVAPLTPLERQTSVSSSSYSASSPSMPPTPGSSGYSHEPFFLNSPPLPSVENAAALAVHYDAELSSVQRPPTPPRRASVVSFELPDESPTEVLRRERPTSHDCSRRTSSSPSRTRGHRRALSESQAVGLGLGLNVDWRGDAASILAEEQWERGKLVVVNPDVALGSLSAGRTPTRPPPRPPRSNNRPSHLPLAPPPLTFEIGLAC